MTVIESATLRLEPLAVAHAAEMFGPMSAAAIYDYIPEAPPASVSSLQQRYLQLERGHSANGRERWLNWVVRLNSGQCAGDVQVTVHAGATADFAFVFAPEYWGRGVAFEACSVALPRLAGEFGVRAAYATVDSRNSRSVRLLERLGFHEVAAEAYPHGDVQSGDRVFSLSFS
jgi:ribosomal-protein-alanine N-acetyltransferase